MNLDNLNKRQKEAVVEPHGPMLILAGAGSGKTHTLTSRIAYLIQERGVDPRSILAITFTNKAAKEMKSRIEKNINCDTKNMWVGTFHSICVKILRIYAEELGYTNHFLIYDTEDQKKLIRNLIKDLKNDPTFSNKYDTVESFYQFISSVKRKLSLPDDYKKELYNKKSEVEWHIYESYNNLLKLNNAMDFDDLILNVNDLFQKREDILERYINRFHEVMVDEYQDTNKAQYFLISKLTKKKKNIVVVGDDNQSIYKWRGADIRNILEFNKDFSKAKVVKLEENFRSTTNILNGANTLISNNPQVHPKKLWSNRGEGSKIIHYNAVDDKEEARYVVDKIKELLSELSPKQIAILYRNHSLSRNFEKELMANNIPCQIIKGMAFFGRKEIKDILAYARVLVNENDYISFERAISVPRRGIGNKALQLIIDYASENQKSLIESIREMIDKDLFKGTVKKNLKIFLNIFDEAINIENPAEIVNHIFEASGYKDMLEQKDSEEETERINNISQLISDIQESYESDGTQLIDYLANISLESDQDTIENKDSVSLMTLHTSKGLEYDAVFIVGFNEGIFPGIRAIKSYNPESEMQEERRLCYVGITRAKKYLYLCSAKMRSHFGSQEGYSVSRFISDIDSRYIEEHASTHRSRSDFSFKPARNINFSKNKRKNIDPNDIQLGTKVKHKVLGEGTVVSKEDKIIKVAFLNQGIKTINLDLAPLEVLK